MGVEDEDVFFSGRVLVDLLGELRHEGVLEFPFRVGGHDVCQVGVLDELGVQVSGRGGDEVQRFVVPFGNVGDRLVVEVCPHFFWLKKMWFECEVLALEWLNHDE